MASVRSRTESISWTGNTESQGTEVIWRGGTKLGLGLKISALEQMFWPVCYQGHSLKEDQEATSLTGSMRGVRHNTIVQTNNMK